MKWNTDVFDDGSLLPELQSGLLDERTDARVRGAHLEALAKKADLEALDACFGERRVVWNVLGERAASLLAIIDTVHPS